jgi:hypothetical protein
MHDRYHRLCTMWSSIPCISAESRDLGINIRFTMFCALASSSTLVALGLGANICKDLDDAVLVLVRRLAGTKVPNAWVDTLILDQHVFQTLSRVIVLVCRWCRVGAHEDVSWLLDYQVGGVNVVAYDYCI